MRFTVSKSALARAISVVSKCLTSNHEKPILGGILVSANDGSIVMQATDTNVSIRHVMPANVDEEGATVVSGRLLAAIVKNLPDAAVEFSQAGDTVTVACEKARFTLRTFKAKDFPEFPEVVESQSIELPSDLLATMVDKVYKVTSKDNSRPILAGVLLRVADGMIRLVATDAYRLAICDAGIESEQSFEAIVPGNAIHQVLSMPTMTEAIAIGASDNQVTFSFGSTTYVTRRIEGSFPNYRQLLPSTCSVKVSLNADELSQALRRAGVVAVSNPSVRFAVDGDAMTLFASSPDHGESTETIGASTDGDPMSIGLNYHYVLDGVDAMSGEVFLEMSSPMQPAVFKSYADISYLYLLMPVRL